MRLAEELRVDAVFNFNINLRVAGDGVLYLSQCARLAGRPTAPIPPPLVSAVTFSCGPCFSALTNSSSTLPRGVLLFRTTLPSTWLPVLGTDTIRSSRTTGGGAGR